MDKLGKVRKLPVHERFYSWQGEGVHSGRAAYFVRLFGCPVKCEWCDSAGTWHPRFVPEKVERFAPADLAVEAAQSAASFVVVTGGEPAIHDLNSLCSELEKVGLRRHLETSGAFPIQGEFDWITVSPKWQKLPLVENLTRANEVKIIVEDENSIEKWIHEIGSSIKDAEAVWLHPEWSQKDNPKVLESITRFVKENAGPYRAGYQMHKLFNADLLDPKSQKPAPLGGDEAKGF